MRKNLKIDSFFSRTKATPSAGDSSIDTNENFQQKYRDELCFEPANDKLKELTLQVGSSCSWETIGASIIAAALESGVNLDSVRSDFDVNNPGTWIPNNLLAVVNDEILI